MKWNCIELQDTNMYFNRFYLNFNQNTLKFSEKSIENFAEKIKYSFIHNNIYLKNNFRNLSHGKFIFKLRNILTHYSA